MVGTLYVRDEEAKRLADELAEQRGLTQTAAVKLALVDELARNRPERSPHEIVEELRRTSTLRFDPTIVIDKAFYDSLNDEEDDGRSSSMRPPSSISSPTNPMHRRSSMCARGMPSV